MIENPKLLESFYKSLYKIRSVEEEIARIYPTDKIKSPIHLSIGQEAVSVGVCEALRPSDVVFGSYRGHAMYIAKGGDLKRMIAELYGKITGCAKGKGGSMHLIDIEKGIMGTSAIVGTTIPLSVGYAYSLKYRNADSVTAVFFGVQRRRFSKCRIYRAQWTPFRITPRFRQKRSGLYYRNSGKIFN